MSKISDISLSRLSWIDNAKAIAILAVVWMHVGNIIPADFDVLPRGFIISFNMHLFVFLSGLCAFKSISRVRSWGNLWEYIKKSCFRIGLPNLCFYFLNLGVWSRYISDNGGGIFNPVKLILAFVALGFILYIIEFIEKKRNSAFENIAAFVIMCVTLSGKVNSFWFLPFIFQTGLMAAFTNYIARKYLHYSLFPVMFAISMALYPSTFHATMEMWTFYIAGFYITKHDLITRLSKEKQYVIGALSLIVYVLLFVYGRIDTNWYYTSFFDLLQDSSISVYFIRQVMAFAMIVFVTMLCNVVLQKKSFLSNIGMQTLALYSLHCMIIDIILNFGLKTLIPLSLISKPIIVISIVLLSMGIINYSHRFDIISKTFFGKYKLL